MWFLLVVVARVDTTACLAFQQFFIGQTTQAFDRGNGNIKMVGNL